MAGRRHWWQRLDPELGLLILSSVSFFVVGYAIALVRAVAP